MSRPSFQFYPADWRNNAKLRRCSWAARGVWIEILGLMHDSDEYGVLRWPLKDIARAVGAPLAKVKELAQKGVLYGLNEGICDPMFYRPVSGRVEGTKITLVEAQEGPIWYSPRMVKDEYLRQKRGVSTRFTKKEKPPPDPSPTRRVGEGQGDAPNPSPSGAPIPRQSDGASSSSSSSEIGNSTESVKISKRADERARAQKPAEPSDPGPDPNPTPQAEAAAALRRLGMLDVHPSRPELLGLLADGATIEQLTDTARELIEVKGRPPNLGYLTATIRGRAADAAQQPPPLPGEDSRGTATDRRNHRPPTAHERAEQAFLEATASAGYAPSFARDAEPGNVIAFGRQRLESVPNDIDWDADDRDAGDA